MTSFDVVTFGETMIQLSPLDQALAEAASLMVGVAGAESNLACFLAAVGHRVCWVGDVGDDPWGERIVATIGGYGVDVSRVERRAGAATGLYVKEPAPSGTRVHYYRAGSAASRLGVADRARLPLAGARVLHVTGITPALSASCADLVDKAISLARSIGVTVSFDVNYRSGLWSSAVEAAETLARCASAADIVFVGRDEAEAVWGTRTPGDVARVLGVRHLIVKDGAVGATSFRIGRRPVFEPAPVVDVVEPVGAGDAFAAGYLDAVLRGAGEGARLRQGHRVAAVALGSHGDLPSPERVREGPDAERRWATGSMTSTVLAETDVEQHG